MHTVCCMIIGLYCAYCMYVMYCRQERSKSSSDPQTHKILVPCTHTPPQPVRGSSLRPPPAAFQGSCFPTDAAATGGKIVDGMTAPPSSVRARFLSRSSKPPPFFFFFFIFAVPATLPGLGATMLLTRPPSLSSPSSCTNFLAHHALNTRRAAASVRRTTYKTFFR